MSLTYTTHEPIPGRICRAEIFEDGGSPKQRKVGMSERRVDREGGYLYRVTDLDGIEVYDGEKMSDGLAALQERLNKKVVDSHRLTDVWAVWCADGTTGLCGVTLGKLPEGVEIVGNGTISAPLGVKLSGVYGEAPDLARALKGAKNALVAADKALEAIAGAAADVASPVKHVRERAARDIKRFAAEAMKLTGPARDDAAAILVNAIGEG